MTHELDAVNTMVSKTDTAPVVRNQAYLSVPLPLFLPPLSVHEPCESAQIPRCLEFIYQLK